MADRKLIYVAADFTQPNKRRLELYAKPACVVVATYNDDRASYVILSWEQMGAILLAVQENWPDMMPVERQNLDQ